MKWSKQVESYYITEVDHGIYTLLFNTIDKWIPYHRYDNNMYEIGHIPVNCSEVSLDDFNDKLVECVQEVHNFLPKDKKYVVSHWQEKDQICFIFIPREIYLTKISQIEFLKPKENDTK